MQHNISAPSASDKPISLYIHWPFCKSKCPYCDFNSHVRERIDEKAFVKALLGELDYTLELVGKRQLVSIFFGGGTPSLMSAGAVEQVLAHVAGRFRSNMNIEITLEANPTSVEAEKFRGFRAAGVNRVSLGVQSLRAESLKFLGREHSANEALKAVDLAAKTFPCYSFDLIYALPNQTLKSWEAELSEALQYVGDHLSVYQLTIEERTAFYHAYYQQKAFELPVEDLAADLYELTQDVLEAAGLPAYEISNHARPGFESQHNLSYWLGREYIGIGPGAHGRLQLNGQKHATKTISSPERWLEMAQQHGHGLEENTPLTTREVAEEQLMMRLRLTGEIPLAELPPLNPATLKQLEINKLIEQIDNGLRLTRQGMLLQQMIVGELAAALAS